MLHLIVGTAGTGKTTLLHERIGACVKNGGKAILIVPEQSSFESEKALYRRLGAQDALSVEVLSFTRLCDRIFRALGGLAGVHMDETAKYLLMSIALGELGDTLTAYRKSCGSAAFISSMCDTVSELKAAGITPDELRRVAESAGDSGFADKLGDIALIFDAYQAIIERGYSDPDDSLRRACKKLEEEDFFSDYSVFVDGFMAFMGAEWKLLAHILEASEDVTVALTCENLSDRTKTGVFSAPVKTAHRLIETAKRCGCDLAEPVVLEQARRFRNPALEQIAADYPKPRHTPCDFEAQGVEIVRCEDVYDELEYIAAQISDLVREQGCRYREIALIGRSLDRYLVPLQTVFARYEIPFFTDLRADIQVYPLASGLLCALDAVRSGFDSDFMLALAKNCITGIDCFDAGVLENYCFTWGVSKSAWESDFINNPDGMTDGFSDAQIVRLEELNALRRQLVAPLVALRRALEDCDGRGFAKAAFDYLAACKAAEHLQESASRMDETAQKQFLDTGAQVWDIIIGLLDVFGGALAGVHLPLARLIDLFRMSIAAADIGSLPQTLDQVIVGAADRIRPNEPKAVFVIGLNEGEFPLWGVSGGLFSAAERDRLGAQGIDLLRTPEQYAVFEKYFVYFALTQASERLWLTYPLKNTAGGSLAPSSVIGQVREITGVLEHGSHASDALARVGNPKTAFDVMTRRWREQSPSEMVLKRHFAACSPEQMAVLTRMSGARTFQMYDGEAARSLFGERMHISPSRAERFYSCPFSYFCQAGLRLNPRKKVEFNPIESGSLIHLVLEKIVKKYGGKGLSAVSEADMRTEISALINENLESKIKDFGGMPARFKYLFRRLVDTLMRLIQRLAAEFAQSEFEPEVFELPIGEHEAVKPLLLETPDGTRVIVEGVVDRVDVLTRDGKKYIRVVDYKSGHKTFNLADIYYGLNMQMLVYLFSICDNPPPQEEPVPAGVLYMPAIDSVIVTERGESAQAVQEAQIKRLKMNGILLDDYEMLSAMEKDLAGVFIPVKKKSGDELDARSSVASLAQMGVLKKRVETLLTDIASQLYDGNVSATPVDGLADYTPCKWCDYHAVCAHEDADAVRKAENLSRDELFRRLEKVEQDG